VIFAEVFKPGINGHRKLLAAFIGHALIMTQSPNLREQSTTSDQTTQAH